MCNERESRVASDNASAEPLQTSDSRRTMPPSNVMSEDQYREAWLRRDEGIIEANIAGGPEPTCGS